MHKGLEVDKVVYVRLVTTVSVHVVSARTSNTQDIITSDALITKLTKKVKSKRY